LNIKLNFILEGTGNDYLDLELSQVPFLKNSGKENGRLRCTKFGEIAGSGRLQCKAR
jgi:hypothetical protein